MIGPRDNHTRRVACDQSAEAARVAFLDARTYFLWHFRHPEMRPGMTTRGRFVKAGVATRRGPAPRCHGDSEGLNIFTGSAMKFLQTVLINFSSLPTSRSNSTSLLFCFTLDLWQRPLSFK